MNTGQLSEGAAVSVRYAARAPRVESLWGLAEMGPDDAGPYRLDDAVVGVELGSHAPQYQHSVYISRGQSFIGLASALMHKLDVADDPEFGVRLRLLIADAGYKNPRRFAIEGMDWPDNSGPQRLTNYLRGRIPDLETAVTMAERLNVSMAALFGLNDANSQNDEALTDILRNLLALEGISPEKANTIASASLAAQRLLPLLPEDDPLSTRAKYAARVAWSQRLNPTPST